MDGYIQTQIATGGHTDANGETVPAEVSWGAFVECKYKANTLNNRGVYSGGRFTQMAFEITTEDMGFRSKRIRLFDSRQSLVCEKDVQGFPEVLETVQRVKITV
jgi:hypothetical protein